MVNRNRQLMLEQLDGKLDRLRPLRDLEIPPKGWINAIRTTLNMSLLQLGKRLKMTPVGAKDIEDREQNKSITLKKMMEVGDALGFRFVYGFIPKESSIEMMIEVRAGQLAREIVMRTSQTMGLEEQQNSAKRLRRAIKERAQGLKEEIPKRLWD